MLEVVGYIFLISLIVAVFSVYTTGFILRSIQNYKNNRDPLYGVTINFKDKTAAQLNHELDILWAEEIKKRD